MVTCIQSRGFGTKNIETGEEMQMVIPYADMVNHSE